MMQMVSERREVSATAAAKELGCDRKTIYRDFHVLEEIGVPLYQEGDGPRARWKVVDGPRRKLALTLSWSEVLALTAGRDLLGGLAGTFFHDAAVTALDKVGAALPVELAARAHAATDVLLADRRASGTHPGRGQVVQTVAEAIRSRKTIALTYRKLGARGPEERVVDPYHLHVQVAAVYVIGYCHRRRALRTFLLDRATDARTTDDVFARRPELHPEEVLQGELGPWAGRAVTIRLRFSARVARLVFERKVHPSQTAQWRQDDLLDVELHAPPSHLLWSDGCWGGRARSRLSRRWGCGGRF